MAPYVYSNVLSFALLALPVYCNAWCKAYAVSGGIRYSPLWLLDLPRFRAAPTARLGHFLFEGDRTVSASAEWWRFGLQNPFMYSKIALSACRRVSHEWRQISSALGRLCASSKANINSKTGKPYDTKSFARSGHDDFTRR